LPVSSKAIVFPGSDCSVTSAVADWISIELVWSSFGISINLRSGAASNDRLFAVDLRAVSNALVFHARGLEVRGNTSCTSSQVFSSITSEASVSEESARGVQVVVSIRHATGVQGAARTSASATDNLTAVLHLDTNRWNSPVRGEDFP